MTKVVTRDERTIVPPVVAIAGGTRTLKLLPERGEAPPFTVDVAGAGIVTVKVDNRTAQNFALFTIAAITPGTTRLMIGNARGGAKLTLAVRIDAAVALPDKNTDAGMLARLLVQENPAPGDPGYTADAARESMTLMRLVLDKRLAEPSGRWSSKGATTMRDVVRAPMQFEGFSRYPDLPDKMVTKIATIVRRANTAGDIQQLAMRAHVQMAITIASGPTPADPTTTGLYWWYKAGVPFPGNNVDHYKDLLGNSFYMEGQKKK